MQRYRDAITTRIQETLPEDDLTVCLEQAVADYSFDRPRRIVADIDGNDTRALALPAAWESDFSELLQVHEISELDGPVLITSDGYDLMTPPDGNTFLLFDEVTDSQNVYRLTFSGRHSVTELTSTLPAADDHLVADLAASHAFFLLAAKITRAENPTLGTVTVDIKSKSEKYRQLALDFRARYDAALGERDNVTDSAVADNELPGGVMMAWAQDSTGIFH